MSLHRVFITRRIFPEAVDFLRQNFEVDYEDSDDVLDADQIQDRAAGAHGIICHIVHRFDAALIEKLTTVKVIANVAVGYDAIDVKAANKAGIIVTNTPDVLSETSADLAFALLLSTARRIVEAHHFVHSGQWKNWTVDLLAGQDIHGRTLGIVGAGRIGQAVARRGRGFNMRVLYYNSRRLPETLEQELGLTLVSKEQLLAESDFVSLNMPLRPETRHFIGAAELALMKPTAILINTARGPVVDENALVDALEKRTIAGAGLDVFENEPKVHPKLLALENVVLAPHIASSSVATRRRMSMMAAENVAAVLKGLPPLNPVIVP
jgi:lactate dehydrogenase-like 2-hydroxyacid dehydrogenase